MFWTRGTGVDKPAGGRGLRTFGLLAAIALLATIALGAPRLSSAQDSDVQVVAGQTAQKGAWPAIASLRRSGSHFCGGDLIDPLWVVTAAHCVSGSSPSGMSVVLGEHDRSVQEGTEQTIAVSQIIVHSGWGSGLNNDIALLRLAQPATLNQWVKTIPLATTADSAFYDPGDPGTVAGWGATQYQGSLARVLQQATKPIISNSQCQQSLGSGVTSNMICAGSLSQPQSACNGDSGGPFMINAAGTWKLVGIVSWGRNCQGYSVYTRVPNYVSWVGQYVGTTPVPTATRTRTATSGGPLPSPTRTATSGGPLPSPTRTRTPTQASGSYPAWAPNTSYATGSRVSYGGRNYQCLQGHTSQVGWEPPNVPALWQAL